MRTRIESIRGMVKEGNSCLFLFFVIFNFLIFLSSLGILGCGVYLTVITKEANAFINQPFQLTGGLMFIFSALAFKMRRSIHLLGFYLIILFFVFLFQLIITIVMIVKKEALIELAKKYMSDSQKSYDEIKKFEDKIGEHVLSVSYALIAFTAIIALTIFFGYCYRASTKTKTSKSKENLLNQQRYSDQVRDIEALVQKNNEKRVLYEQKYPELAKHRGQNQIQ